MQFVLHTVILSAKERTVKAILFRAEFLKLFKVALKNVEKVNVKELCSNSKCNLLRDVLTSNNLFLYYNGITKAYRLKEIKCFLNAQCIAQVWLGRIWL